ncbi:MAG: helix-turn-helix transcriptional regulator [Fulvivirga sp.]|uniref:helix-turn-helix domain-containing protein n=1 Tax=Fulvivirga sp. TaxID=1931237 RepID=UPI0032EB4E3E
MKSDLKRQIGDKLIKLRQEQNLSQEKLANMAGLDRSYISRIERSLISPTLENFFKICKALEIEPYKFLEKM